MVREGGGGNADSDSFTGRTLRGQPGEQQCGFRHPGSPKAGWGPGCWVNSAPAPTLSPRGTLWVMWAPSPPAGEMGCRPHH